MTQLTTIFLATLLVACGASAPQQKLNPAGEGTGTGMCTVVRDGGEFRFAESTDSVIVMVSAPPAKRAHVRRYLRSMAARHEDRRFNYQTSIAHREALPAHATSLEYSESGARVMYRPLKVEELAALETRLRKHVADLPVRCGKKPTVVSVKNRRD